MVTEDGEDVAVDGRGDSKARQMRRSLLGVRVKLLTGRFVGSLLGAVTVQSANLIGLS